MLQVSDIPRTGGSRSALAVRQQVVHGEKVRNTKAWPAGGVGLYRDLPELDALIGPEPR